MRRGAASLAAALLLLAAPVAQAQDENVVRAREVHIEPGEGAEVVVNGRRYGGKVRISSHGSGLAVVETVDLESYLAGIQEVPFSWEPAALEAQAIAARTYLAWTLARGRTDAGRAYDYDICATDACQVYAGLEPVLGSGGERWLDAVRSTGSQILLYDGEPAQTYYSSTSGGRTRTASDVWPDVDLPYLEAVESPGEDSPFAEWSFSLPEAEMQRLVAEAELVTGRLRSAHSTVRDDGDGPWTVTFRSDREENTVDTWTLRTRLNRAAAPLGDWLPALRPDGKRYPQTILSPSFTITGYRIPLSHPPGGMNIYVIEGNGWGHLVGMSQYGAQAMAEEGATAAEILEHYYGGLRPEEAAHFVPETVEVALELGVSEFGVGVTGPVSVTVDGEEIAEAELGSWEMRADRGSIEVITPVGLGLPPRLRPGPVAVGLRRFVIHPELMAAAEVTWVVTVGGEVIEEYGPEPVDAGFLRVPVPLHPLAEVRIEAVNAHGRSVLELGARTGSAPD